MTTDAAPHPVDARGSGALLWPLVAPAIRISAGLAMALRLTRAMVFAL
jgi:hypothetical protein